MTHNKKCLKCGHSAEYIAEPPTACPACGAVYAKVEQAMREGPPPRPLPAPTSSPYLKRDHHSFATQLRHESIYPTFRAVVKIAYWLGVIASVLIAIGGITASFSAGVGALLGGLALAALIFVFSKVAKEMSLMLADLSDATVRTAARAEAQARDD